MDAYIGHIVADVPYLWLDHNFGREGLTGWHQGRFSRVYLTKQSTPLVPTDTMMHPLRAFFRMQATPVSASRFHDIRLNGRRVLLTTLFAASERRDLEAKRMMPLEALLRALALPPEAPSVPRLLALSLAWPKLLESPEEALKTTFAGSTAFSLCLTDVGLYSVTRWRDAQTLIACMERYVDSDLVLGDLVITDACAGVGGDVFQFSQRFKHVNAVELLPLHCAVIENNMIALRGAAHRNVTVLCANYVDVLGIFKFWPGKALHQNVVYFDPPWGGPGYLKHKKLELQLDGVPVSRLVEFLFRNQLAQFVFVKAPQNVDVKFFPPLKAIRIGRFKLLCMRRPT